MRGKSQNACSSSGAQDKCQPGAQVHTHNNNNNHAREMCGLVNSKQQQPEQRTRKHTLNPHLLWHL